MSFKVLGPLQAEVDGERIRLGGTRQRTVLAMLLLAPDRAVSVEALTEAVWQGAPPATARNQIAICMTALRRIFRDAGVTGTLIETVPNGYILHLGDHRLDLLEMETLAAEARRQAREGRLGEAAQTFEQALAMWYGPALDGLSGGRVEQATARLTETWLDVSEEYAALQLQLGQYRPVVSRLTDLVKKYPLREQARLHLMEAQRRSGRRGDALETYREGRRVFIEELGIELGQALQELHRRILQESDETDASGWQHPGTGTAATVTAAPAQLPASPASFTGRAEEIATLDRLLHVLEGQRPPAIAVLSGVSGVGKTALAVHWANRVAQNFPDGNLFIDMRGYHEHEEPVSPMSALERFLRALGVPSSQIPDDLQERAAYYRSVLDGRRALIVLDNVRSLAQVLPLLPGDGDCCVLVTSRDSLEYLCGDYAVVRIGLKPLAPDEAVRMLAATIGHGRITADPDMAERLVTLCGRLPLALRIAGAQLATKPHRSLAQLVSRLEDRHRRLDLLSPNHGGVRAGFRLSYRELPLAAARMYRRLGLLAVPDFSAWVGAAVLDMDVEQAEDLMEQLVNAQLLEVEPGPPSALPRFRFQNLLRLFAWERAQEEDSPAEREAALDRAFGMWLALADHAHERLSGRGHLAPLRDTLVAKLPDHRVEALVPDPIEWFESERLAITDVVRQCAQSGRTATAWALAVRAIPLYEMRDHPEDWRGVAECALEAAREADDVAGIGTMLRSLGAAALYQRRHQEAESFLRDAMVALEKTGDTHGCAITLRNLALCARFTGDLDRAARHCREALGLFAGTEDLAGRAHALGLLAQIELERGDVQLSITLTREAIVISREADSLRGETQNLYRLSEALLRAGEWSDAERTGHRVVELTRAQGDRLGEAHGLRVLGEARWRRSLPVEAEASLAEALSAARDVEDRFLQARVTVDLACALAVRGGEGARERLEAAGAEFRALAACLWAERTGRLLEVLRGFGPGEPVPPSLLAGALDG
ncbi:BTAD domain-containing putative transcriptional regulator [Streptomyces glaucosporus]|uniref:BTAD domain-containing putative transcriptional regulator n=1 Tax=Streptomyces glaucosporus TaxID=284044 RepID=A0ABN3HKJ9_9ACTN